MVPNCSASIPILRCCSGESWSHAAPALNDRRKSGYLIQRQGESGRGKGSRTDTKYSPRERGFPCLTLRHRRGGWSRRYWPRLPNFSANESRSALATAASVPCRGASSSVASQSCRITSARKRSSAAGETLAEIAKSYAVDISMISRLQA
jgi:hypothetical protein